MARRLVFALIFLTFGCGHDVPEHDVVVSSDCSGTLQSGRFHFEAWDYDQSCSGDWMNGNCQWDDEPAKKLSGDLEPERFVLQGYEGEGASQYVLWLNPPVAGGELIWCGWYTTDDLELKEGSHTACYFSETPCTADLRVER